MGIDLWSRADPHTHTFYGEHRDSPLSPERLLEMDRALNEESLEKTGRRAIDVRAITDHDTLDGYFRAHDYRERKSSAEQFLYPVLIPGEEISSLDGHIIGLFLKAKVPPKMPADETLAAIREQKYSIGTAALRSLTDIPHPFTCFILPFIKFDGEGKHYKGLGKKIFSLPGIDAVETINAPFTQVFANYWTPFIVNAYTALHGKKPFALLGASDAHFPSNDTMTAYTEFPGATAEDFYDAIINKTTRAIGYAYGVRVLVESYEKFKAHHPQAVELCKELKLPAPKTWEEMVPPNIMRAIQYVSRTKDQEREHLYQRLAYAAEISVILMGIR